MNFSYDRFLRPLSTTDKTINILNDDGYIVYNINQGVTPYMITGLTINGGGNESIKWYNGSSPSGTSNHIDKITLMFVYNNTGVLSQVLGQIGTFA